MPLFPSIYIILRPYLLFYSRVLFFFNSYVRIFFRLLFIFVCVWVFFCRFFQWLRNRYANKNTEWGTHRERVYVCVSERANEGKKPHRIIRSVKLHVHLCMCSQINIAVICLAGAVASVIVFVVYFISIPWPFNVLIFCFLFFGSGFSLCTMHKHIPISKVFLRIM